MFYLMSMMMVIMLFGMAIVTVMCIDVDFVAVGIIKVLTAVIMNTLPVLMLTMSVVSMLMANPMATTMPMIMTQQESHKDINN